jgi:hypothetical protein
VIRTLEIASGVKIGNRKSKLRQVCDFPAAGGLVRFPLCGRSRTSQKGHERAFAQKVEKRDPDSALFERAVMQRFFGLSDGSRVL